MAARKKTARGKAKRPAAKKKTRTAPRPAKKAKTRVPARPAAPKLKARRQPESLRVRSVAVGYTVSDINASMAWYRDVLGCVVADTWMHDGTLMGATLRSGNAEFFLGQDDFKKGRNRSLGHGVRIYCTTAQSVDQLAAQVKAAGGRLTHDPTTQSWGTRDFGVVDPDGYNITIQNTTP